jgi:hypothetical protein
MKLVKFYCINGPSTGNIDWYVSARDSEAYTMLRDSFGRHYAQSNKHTWGQYDKTAKHVADKIHVERLDLGPDFDSWLDLLINEPKFKLRGRNWERHECEFNGGLETTFKPWYYDQSDDLISILQLFKMYGHLDYEQVSVIPPCGSGRYKWGYREKFVISPIARILLDLFKDEVVSLARFAS